MSRRYTRRRFNRKPSLTTKAAEELKAALVFAETVLSGSTFEDTPQGRARIRAIDRGIDWGVALAEWKMKNRIIRPHKD